MSNEQIPGGWTKFSSEISPEEQDIFNKAIGELTGVNYSPVAVASQVVNGTNYQYFCNGQVVIPNPTNNVYMVNIYVSLSGDLKLEGIRELEHSYSSAI